MISEQMFVLWICVSAFIAVGLTSPTGDHLLQNQIIGCVTVGCSSPKPLGCIGTIKFKTKGTVHSVSAVNALDVVNKKYGKVDTITVDGNCCWRVATRKNMKGRTRDFTQMVIDSNHEEKVKSVKIINCQDEWTDSNEVASDSTTILLIGDGENIIEDTGVDIENKTINMTVNKESNATYTTGQEERATASTKVTGEITTENITGIGEDTNVTTTFHGEETTTENITIIGEDINITTTLHREETTVNTNLSAMETTLSTTGDRDDFFHLL